GKRIYNELMIDPASVADGGLDSSVVSKIRERQENAIRNTIKNQITRDLLAGKTTAQAFEENNHPLLQVKDRYLAVERAKSKIVEEAETEANRSPVRLVLGIIFLLGGLGLTILSGGQVFFYGAILVGLIMLVKFATGTS
ncbi:MAG: hypothetical protein AAGA31_06035, partial [Bacteroidota bacterium]